MHYVPLVQNFLARALTLSFTPASSDTSSFVSAIWVRKKSDSILWTQSQTSYQTWDYERTNPKENGASAEFSLSSIFFCGSEPVLWKWCDPRMSASPGSPTSGAGPTTFPINQQDWQEIVEKKGWSFFEF